MLGIAAVGAAGGLISNMRDSSTLTHSSSLPDRISVQDRAPQRDVSTGVAFRRVMLLIGLICVCVFLWYTGKL